MQRIQVLYLLAICVHIDVYSVGYEVIIITCSFDLHSLMIGWWRASFHILIDPLYMFFGEMSIQVIWLFFNWVIWFSVNSCRVILLCSSLLILISYMVCKCFLPFCILPFHFVDCFLRCWKHVLLNIHLISLLKNKTNLLLQCSINYQWKSRD